MTVCGARIAGEAICHAQTQKIDGVYVNGANEVAIKFESSKECRSAMVSLELQSTV
jgi:hypothetical protein